MIKIKLRARVFDGTTLAEEAPTFRQVGGWLETSLDSPVGILPAGLWGKTPGGDPYLLLGASLIVEGGTALRRFRRRREAFEAAVRRATETGRPLLVVGDPDAGAHTRLLRAYECGDLCIDLRGCPRCQTMKVADITKGPIDGIADDSAVVFVSCVLEYVADPTAALHELARIAGTRENLFLVLVEPWTLTATLYPGARWSGIANERIIAMQPVTTTLKVATIGSLAILTILARRRP